MRWFWNRKKKMDAVLYGHEHVGHTYLMTAAQAWDAGKVYPPLPIQIEHEKLKMFGYRYGVPMPPLKSASVKDTHWNSLSEAMKVYPMGDWLPTDYMLSGMPRKKKQTGRDLFS